MRSKIIFIYLTMISKNWIFFSLTLSNIFMLINHLYTQKQFKQSFTIVSTESFNENKNGIVFTSKRRSIAYNFFIIKIS